MNSGWQKRQRKESGVLFFFKYGSCSDGDSCRFRHDGSVPTNNVGEDDARHSTQSLQKLPIKIVTYGVKYVGRSGWPEADLHFDARCFNDPHAGNLKEHDGHHEEIISRMAQHDDFDGWFLNIVRQVLRVHAEAGAEGLDSVIVAIYCKSGRHRSVAGALILRFVLKEMGLFVEIEHLHLYKCVCDHCTGTGHKALRAMTHVVRVCEEQLSLVD